MNNSTEQAVDFLGHQINCVHDADGTPYLPLKWLCEILGIDDKGQRREVKDRGGYHWKMLSVKGADGRHRNMLCLRFDDLYAWLLTVDAHTVRRELVGRFVAYREAFGREQYWRERSEEGRDLPKVPDNASFLIDGFSNEIRESLMQIRDTIRSYERYAIYKEVYAANSPIVLSILAGLSKDLAKLSEEVTNGFHTMLDVNDYWLWCCCNDAKAAKELGKELESLANQGHRIDQEESTYID
jgi:hypothetical protein